jgi:hypothetical protein
MSDALSTVFDAARKWRDELTEYIEPDAVKRGADEDAEGYESEADQISAALEQLQPITVYFTGDTDGPDRFGTVYDTEDEALEVARENCLAVYRVSVVPDWDNAECIHDAEGSNE